MYILISKVKNEKKPKVKVDTSNLYSEEKDDEEDKEKEKETTLKLDNEVVEEKVEKKE